LLSNDFFKWTLVTSAVFHLFLVLGISFVMPDSGDQTVIGPALKIILVSNANNIATDDAKTLSQSDSTGEDDAASGLPAIDLASQQVAQEPQPQNELLDINADTATRNSNDSIRENSSTNPALTRQQLTENINLAYLNAQSLPREAYATANSRESKYAAYIEKWRLQVERVGNLNYPEAARQQKLEGSLVLDVSISSDGQVHKVRVLKTSEIKMLDDAAERIVHIAAPFDRFPDGFAREIDTLHIVRTWEFGHGRVVSRNLELELE
jgi:protein TonB